MQLKEQLSAASIGHGLLKKKSDHIKKLLQDILKQIVVVKRRVGQGSVNAFFSLTEAHWAAGEIKYLLYSFPLVHLLIL